MRNTTEEEEEPEPTPPTPPVVTGQASGWFRNAALNPVSYAIYALLVGLLGYLFFFRRN